MKGCLAVVGGIVVVGLILMVGFCGYLGKKMYDIGNEVKASFVQLEQTNKDFPFSKPSSSKLDAVKLEQVLAMRARVAQGASATLKQFKDMERGGDADWRKVIEQMKEGINTLKRVPIDLENELRTARMSFNEYVWTLDTAYGTIFRAADTGNAAAAEVSKAIQELIVDPKAPGHKAEENYQKFRNRTMASVYDTSSIDVVMAHKDALIGDKATVFFDFFMSNRGENIQIGGG